MPLQATRIGQAGSKGGQGLGSLLGTLGGGAIGFFVGGPAGALKGASMGSQIGGTAGKMVAPEKQAIAASQTQQEENAMTRRIKSGEQRANLSAISEAAKNLQALPVEERGAAGETLMQAQQLLKQKGLV